MMALDFSFRLKTGFFETSAFNLLIRQGQLVLSSTEAKERTITITEENLVSITLKNEKSLEIEIQTRDSIYQGIFPDKAVYERLLEQLQENLNKKIVCEYEGRR